MCLPNCLNARRNLALLNLFSGVDNFLGPVASTCSMHYWDEKMLIKKLTLQIYPVVLIFLTRSYDNDLMRRNDHTNIHIYKHLKHSRMKSII